MGWFEGNVVAGHPAFGNAIRYQILLDREVRKLYHWRAVHIHHSNQARARRQHFISWVFRPLVLFERKTSSLPRFENEKFRKLFNTKRTAGNHNTLEWQMRIRSIVFINVQQRSLVGLIQRLGQIVQSLPDTRRKTTAQPVQLAEHPVEPVLNSKDRRGPSLTCHQLFQRASWEQAPCYPFSISGPSGLSL